jgi:outer membrane protein
MQKLLLSLNIVLILLFGAFFMHSCKSKGKDALKEVPGAVLDKTVKIAYVDLDTLESKYDYFTIKKAELEKKALSMKSTLESKQQTFQNFYQDAERKSETMTQSEIQATQMKLQQMQQDLETMQQSYSDQMAQEQDNFGIAYQTRIEEYLKKYNADKKYSFILSYRSASGSLLYKDDAYDITSLVLVGLNEEYKESSTVPAK